MVKKFATWLAESHENIVTNGKEYQLVNLTVETYGPRYEFLNDRGELDGAAAKLFGPVRVENKFKDFIVRFFPNSWAALKAKLEWQENLVAAYKAENERLQNEAIRLSADLRSLREVHDQLESEYDYIHTCRERQADMLGHQRTTIEQQERVMQSYRDQLRTAEKKPLTATKIKKIIRKLKTRKAA